MSRPKRRRGFAPDGFEVKPHGRMDKTLMQSRTIETLMSFMLKVFRKYKSEIKLWDDKETMKELHTIVGYWSLCRELKYKYDWKDPILEQLKDIIKFGKEKLKHD